MSKIKLNKKRQVQVERDSDGEPIAKEQIKYKYIVIAPRGLAAEDRSKMLDQMSSLGMTEAGISESQEVFKDKDRITQIEQAASQQLKALFKVSESSQSGAVGETKLEKLSRLLGKSSKAQEEDHPMQEQNSEDDIFEEQSEKEADKIRVEAAKSESAVSEDDIF